VQAFVRNDVDPAAQKALKIGDQSPWEPGGQLRSRLDQKVHIALIGRVTSGHGPENPDIPSAMPRENRQDIVTLV
jgi:hypothetical protein